MSIHLLTVQRHLPKNLYNPHDRSLLHHQTVTLPVPVTPTPAILTQPLPNPAQEDPPPLHLPVPAVNNPNPWAKMPKIIHKNKE